MTTKTKQAYAAMLIAMAAYEEALAEEYACNGYTYVYRIEYQTGKRLGDEGERTFVQGYESFEEAKAELTKRTADFSRKQKPELQGQLRSGIENKTNNGWYATYTFCYMRKAWIRPVRVEINEAKREWVENQGN